MDDIGVHKSNFLREIDVFTSKDIQKEIWINPENDLIGDFVEDVNMLYDTGIDRALEFSLPIFGEPTDTILREFDELIDEIDDELEQLEIINDPKMELVREKAKQLKELVKNSKAIEGGVKILVDMCMNFKVAGREQVCDILSQELPNGLYKIVANHEDRNPNNPEWQFMIGDIVRAELQNHGDKSVLVAVEKVG